MKFYIDNYEVSFVFQPIIKNGLKISSEALIRINGVDDIEKFVRSRDCKELDSFVINSLYLLIDKYSEEYVSINVSSCSLECCDFINECIELFHDRKIILEMTEYCKISNVEVLNNNIKNLNNNGIHVFLDDFGKEFNVSSLIYQVNFNGVKIDKEFIDKIDVDFNRYKYLVCLKRKLSEFGYKNIIYEGVENAIQKNIIEMFQEEPIIQGYLYSIPMSLDQINGWIYCCKGYNFEKHNDSELERKLYDIILDDFSSVNLLDEIRKKDPFGVISSYSVADDMIRNFRELHYGFNDYLSKSMIKLINISDKMLVIRNEFGEVIYENNMHREFIGFDSSRKSVSEVIKLIPDYAKCLKDDEILINSGQSFLITEEYFNDNTYMTCRQKINFGDKVFIMTSINIKKNGSIHVMDALTDCYTKEFLKNNFEMNGRYKNCLIAFIDLNGFKLINDKYGHSFGDECLRDFSNLLKHNLRSNGLDDTVIGFGGDEFIILFNAQDTMVINERLMDINKVISDHFKNKDIDLSFSYGVSKNEFDDINKAIAYSDEKCI
ncbi:TPA: GGDEF domain-containing protein [Vibrio vulnificus]|nr:GGDEF domain-containing protein [Vibrio vulnificus]